MKIRRNLTKITVCLLMAVCAYVPAAQADITTTLLAIDRVTDQVVDKADDEDFIRQVCREAIDQFAPAEAGQAVDVLERCLDILR